MASPARLIDAVPSTSSQPTEMQVLALGMSRTGTYSMYNALQLLGYKSYHMGHLPLTPPGTSALWVEGLKAKYHREGKKYGTPELKKLLSEYSAVTDIPCLMFTEELLAAYPDAKILITNRDEETWLWSVSSLFNTLLGWKWGLVARYDPIYVQPYIEILTIVWNQWTGGNWNDKERLRQTFRDHYALVREKVSKEKLLEFSPKHGWGPLCKHLGKEIPNEPYPHLNELAFTIAIHESMWWRTARKAVKTIVLQALVPVSAVAVAGLWYWYQSN